MVVDPPNDFEGIRYGWYQIDKEWWITRWEIPKALQISGKKAEDFLFKFKDEIRTEVEVNKHNGRDFTLYSYDDIVSLWQERDT